jgi:hypothetical protein
LRDRVQGIAAAAAIAVCVAAGASAEPGEAGAGPVAASETPVPPATPAPGAGPAPAANSKTLIVIPEIDTAPQSGTTLGVLPITLTTDAKDQIRRIQAPDVIYSQYFGWGARYRIFDFPSADSQWSLVGGGKQRVEREFDAQYASGITHAERWSWTLHALYDRSGTPRFFGIGNDTTRADETNYLDNQGRIEGMLARNFTPALQLSYLLRYEVVQILPGVLNEVPSIETLYPTVPGLGTTRALDQRLTLAFDTRDSPVVPRSGLELAAFVGGADRNLASSTTFSYFGVDGRSFWALARGAVLAVHAALRYMPVAAEAPFWALSSIGGDRSVMAERQPLRAYGYDRFVDNNSSSASIEFRSRVGGVRAFSTNVDLEVTPFLDLGKVFAAMGESPVSHLHAGGGLAIRAVASPFVVGYVDIGFGPEHLAVFSGINYPF